MADNEGNFSLIGFSGHDDDSEMAPILLPSSLLQTTLDPNDCEKMMDEYSAHNEKVIQGSVLQLYYFAHSMKLIKDMDEELSRIVSEFGGYITTERGVQAWRRDVDVEFPNPETAQRFSEKIRNSVRFYQHVGLNILGQIIPRPTFDELRQKKLELKKINCGSQSCDTTSDFK